MHFTQTKRIKMSRSRLTKREQRPVTVTSYFTPEGHKQRKQGLLLHNWNSIMTDTNPDSIYDSLIATYSHHYNSNITTKSFKHSSNRFRREPWMTNEILQDIRRRDRLSKIKERRNDYKKVRNEIITKIRRAERSYIQKQVQESIGDIKKHWKILKNTINKTNNKTDITTDFFYQGQWINDPLTNANNFNHYYANVGKDTNESVGSSRLDSNHYLHKSRARNEQ